MNMGAFPSGQWGQTVNLLLNASVVRIHQLPPKSCGNIFATAFFLCCNAKKWPISSRFLDAVLQCCPTILGRFPQLDAHFSCRFLEFGRGGGNFFEKKQNKSCCFQNVFNFPAANFLLAAGIFRFFSTVFSLFSSFPFYTYYNKEDFHYEYHYRHRPRLLRHQNSA